MNRLFLITDDDELEQIVARCADDLNATVESEQDWSAAREALVKERFDAVCVDYEAVKIEGLDAFILLDNILQKEQTPGALISRRVSERASQFISALDSFGESIELGDGGLNADLIAPRLKRLLETSSEQWPGAPDASRAEQKRIDVQVRLPSPEEGSLDKVELGRVLYALCEGSANGILHLKNDAIRRRFAFIDGAPVRQAGDRYDEVEKLASAFAWRGGQYRFRAREARKVDTIEPLEFIFDSLARHLPQRRLMNALMPHMDSYPAVSQLWSRRKSKLEGFDHLAAFLQRCDGQTTLEKALGATAGQTVAGFRACLFARQTDLIMLRSEPTPGGVFVRYPEDVARARQERVEADRKSSKAYRATGTGRLDLEAELQDYLKELQQATPYEIFDVWEGCGRRIIQQKYYQMVKSHHPDVYGGNVTGNVKGLAQEIFIIIKEAYNDLIEVEDEQTRPDPRRQQKVDSLQASSEAMTGNGEGSERPHTEEFAAERTSNMQPESVSNDASGHTAGASRKHGGDDARKSRIERLKAKRRSTPIGLAREPSSPVVQGRSRKKTHPPESPERRAQVDKIRRRSTSSVPKDDSTGDKSERAKQAFNRGYKAFREDENEERAFEFFSKAYNLEPDNGKYMTFYGYLLFLNHPDRRDEAEKVLRKAIEMGDRQSLPDTHLFLGHILKLKNAEGEALRHFKRALKLNPESHQAKREIRLHHMRKRDNAKSGGESFLKNLFKK